MQRVLAFDVGERRIGVAVSDAMGWTAQGLTTYERAADDLAADVARLLALAEPYRPVRLLFGLPRNMDGSFGPAGGARARLCRRGGRTVGRRIRFL